MVTRLTGLLNAIMATLATAEYLAVIEPDHGCPPGFQVTVLTEVRGLYVIQGYSRCLHQATSTMTTGACPGGTRKYSADMARPTVRGTVGTVQGEARREMIKICLIG